MKRRPRRSVPATLAALALLGVCVPVAVGSVQLIAGARPWIGYDTVAEALRTAHRGDPVTAVAGALAALAGALMLLAAVLPGRPTVLPLAADPAGDPAGPLDPGASRRGLRATLRTAAASVDGVGRAEVRLRRRTVAVRVRTDRTRTEGLADAVRTALEQRLDQIAPAPRPTVKITLRATRSAP